MWRLEAIDLSSVTTLRRITIPAGSKESPHPRAEHALPPQQRPGNEQHHGHESKHSPNDFNRPARESAKVQSSEPEQNLVPEARFFALLSDRFEEVHHFVKLFRNRKVESRYSPHQDEHKGLYLSIPESFNEVVDFLEPIA